MSRMKPMKAGIIGCGNISGIYLSTLKNQFSRVVEVKACADLIYEKYLDRPGDFKFDALYPGKYKLRAYLDLNKNGVLDFGKISPFETAEPQLFYPDSLDVRSRWETEEVSLKFQ